MDQSIPMSFMDQMKSLEFERMFRQKMFLIQFLAVSKMGQEQNNFESKSFIDYKKKCKKIANKIDKWHKDLELKK